MPADPADITFAGDVADIAELIGALDLGPVHVYGFSYGGLLGQALALDHPGLLRSLIIANSTA
jgi:proline iminopeptidase